MTLRIVITSVAPLFPNAVYGGSQAILSRIAVGLAEAGAEVDILCSARSENRAKNGAKNGEGFALAPNVRVRPLLRLTGAFPDPYEVPPADLAATARDIAPYLQIADLVYLHADIFHFRDLIPASTPVVRSFHDFHYETALVSAFAYTADLTIVPSQYIANCMRATLGMSGLRELEPIQVIPNGVDTSRFTPDGSTDIEGLASRESSDLVLLYPHRPDVRKGIFEALALLARLHAALPDRNVRLLVPRHLDADKLPDMADQYAAIGVRAGELGLSDNLTYLPWVSQDQMPNFYRYGDVTLCPGNIIESFGLTPYESAACGTPAVAVNVAAYRDLPDHPLLRRVDFGDQDAMIAAILELADKKSEADAAPPLPSQFSESHMVDAYVDAFLENPPNAGARPPTSNRANIDPENGDDDGPLTLAPWCYAENDAIYDDYAYGRRHLPALARFLRSRDPEDPFSSRDLIVAGVPAGEIADGLSLQVLIKNYS